MVVDLVLGGLPMCGQRWMRSVRACSSRLDQVRGCGGGWLIVVPEESCWEGSFGASEMARSCDWLKRVDSTAQNHGTGGAQPLYTVQGIDIAQICDSILATI